MLVYLATPYSKYRGGTEEAYRQACRNAALLIKSGVRVFCPIAHSHPIAHHGGLPKLNHDLWLGQDSSMMDRCDMMVICMLQGWQDSYGIQWERDKFVRAGKPVVYMKPGDVSRYYYGKWMGEGNGK